MAKSTKKKKRARIKPMLPTIPDPDLKGGIVSLVPCDQRFDIGSDIPISGSCWQLHSATGDSTPAFFRLDIDVENVGKPAVDSYSEIEIPQGRLVRSAIGHMLRSAEAGTHQMTATLSASHEGGSFVVVASKSCTFEVS